MCKTIIFFSGKILQNMNIGVNKSNMSFTNRNDLPSFYSLATPAKKNTKNKSSWCFWFV